MSASDDQIPQEILTELKTLAHETAPNSNATSAEELLRLLIPQHPEVLADTPSAITAIKEAIDTLGK